jgi:hypothetical protein
VWYNEAMTYLVKRYSKYNAKSSIYNDSVFHSKKEAGYAAELDLRIKAKDIKSWRRQVKISLDVNGNHICNYYIDFEVTHNDGTIELVEVKGFETDVWRLKWKLLEAIYQKEHPEILLTVIK